MFTAQFRKNQMSRFEENSKRLNTMLLNLRDVPKERDVEGKLKPGNRDSCVFESFHFDPPLTREETKSFFDVLADLNEKDPTNFSYTKIIRGAERNDSDDVESTKCNLPVNVDDMLIEPRSTASFHGKFFDKSPSADIDDANSAFDDGASASGSVFSESASAPKIRRWSIQFKVSKDQLISSLDALQKSYNVSALIAEARKPDIPVDVKPDIAKDPDTDNGFVIICAP